jgi:outer membrane protein assembly factor BamD
VIRKYLFLVVLSIATISACADKSLIRSGDSVEVAFNKAKKQFEDKKYTEASRAFETVVSIARGTNYAADAQFYLAESYFKSEDYLMAASEYERYMNYYPRDERREYVQFKEATCYYELSPRYKLDQTETHKALELFQLFNLRYPASDFSTESGQKINTLRDKLAHKMFDAGLFYLRIREYNAAAVYFGQVVNEYPDTIWADQSLAKQLESYELYADNSVAEKKEERYRKATNSYQKFIQLFPDSKLRGDVESRHDDIQKKLSELAKSNS